MINDFNKPTSSQFLVSFLDYLDPYNLLPPTLVFYTFPTLRTQLQLVKSQKSNGFHQMYFSIYPSLVSQLLTNNVFTCDRNISCLSHSSEGLWTRRQVPSVTQSKLVRLDTRLQVLEAKPACTDITLAVQVIHI